MDESSKCPNCCLNPWKERMLRLATDSKFHDVSFIVGNNRVKIGCNRSLLSIHCPVFEAMFCNGMLESSSNSVEIPDINPIVFAAMLQWMSTNTLNISSICHLNNLIKLADKYQIIGLIDSCCLFLKYNTVTIHVITDSILCTYHGVDLGLKNLKDMSIKLRILSYSTIEDVINAISKQLNWNKKSIKLWRVSNRKNATIRPNRYLSPNTEIKINKNNKKEKDDVDADADADVDDLGDIDIDDLDHDNNNNNNNNESMNNLFNLNNMKCNVCYKQIKNTQQSKKKKIDWSQYSGECPTKAIYARLCKSKYNDHDMNNMNNMNNENNMNDCCLLSQSFAFSQNNNNTFEMESDEKINEINNSKNYENKILLFLKYYDVYHECLSLISSILVDKNGNISLILKAIREIAHWSDEREILLFEEEDCNSNKINPIKLNQTIHESSLVDGDIIVFQERSNIFTNLKLNDVTSFFQQYSFNMNHQRNNHRSMSSNRIRRISSNTNNNNNNNNSNNNNNNNNNNMNPIPLDVDDPYTL